MFDWTKHYRGNLTWLPARTIFLARHGSHAYGTNIATSDEDFRGVAIAPREYYLGGLHRFDQAECKDPDLTVFDLRKFIGLAAQNNPNILEILFTYRSDHLVMTPAGERLISAREMFLSKRVRHTFGGYAHSQLRRLKSHRNHLMNPPKSKPTRADFGLPEATLIPGDQLLAAEAAIRQKLDSWSADFMDDLEPATRQAITDRMAAHLAELSVATHGELWPAAARTLGMSDNFIELLAREKRYGSAKREWDQYQTWSRERNPARAALEAQHGFDTKHGMHLVRLLRMCREILSTGKVNVKRPDAEELLSIRAGAWDYERLVSWAETEDSALEELAKTSNLPKSPNLEAIDALCVSLISEAIQ